MFSLVIFNGLKIKVNVKTKKYLEEVCPLKDDSGSLLAWKALVLSTTPKAIGRSQILLTCLFLEGRGRKQLLKIEESLFLKVKMFSHVLGRFSLLQSRSVILNL